MVQKSTAPRFLVWRMFAFLAVTSVAFAGITFAQDSTATDPTGLTGSLMELLNWAVAALTGGAVLLMEGVKRILENFDVKVTAAIKPLQPFLVGTFGAILPLIGNLLGWSEIPTAAILVSSFGTTVVAIVLREYALGKRKRANVAPSRA